MATFTFNSDIPDNVQSVVVSSLSDNNTVCGKWLASCANNNITIRSIHFDTIKMFGPKIGFLFLTSKAIDQLGNEVPGIVFMRGNSVCCLFIVKESGTRNYFMVSVEQIRVPIGKSILETAAGMMDESFNIKGKMIDEIKEELHINVSNNCIHYKDITSTNPPLNTLVQYDGFYPSPGGCDEFINVFSYITEMTSDELKLIHNTSSGNSDEYENIKIHVSPLTWKNIDDTCDAKMIIAASKFDRTFPGIIEY
jgi:ADP-sugar diphosphatase